MDHKRDGPTTCLVYLGIEIDTIEGQLRLPTDKLQRVQALLLEWEVKRTCLRKELESLISHLKHACKVMRYAGSVAWGPSTATLKSAY